MKDRLYPRVRVWKVMDLWYMAQVRTLTKVSFEPNVFDTYEEALEHALIRRTHILRHVNLLREREKVK